MSNDFLSKLGEKAESQLSNSVSPYKKSKEPTHSVQVRDTLYRQLKTLAFKENIKIIDLVEKLIKDGMKVNNYNR
jgi:hypothetical protein